MGRGSRGKGIIIWLVEPVSNRTGEDLLELDFLKTIL